jgi:hypothetical protein
MGKRSEEDQGKPPFDGILEGLDASRTATYRFENLIRQHEHGEACRWGEAAVVVLAKALDGWDEKGEGTEEVEVDMRPDDLLLRLFVA